MMYCRRCDHISKTRHRSVLLTFPNDGNTLPIFACSYPLAAAAAIGYEQPKILSVPPAINLDRRERWRIYEQWSLRREIVMKTRDTPPPGWADHLSAANYVEPPESEGMPPVDVIDTPQGFKILSNLLPKPGSQRKLGNGNGDDHS